MARRRDTRRTTKGEGAAQAHLHAHPEVPGWGADIDPGRRPGVPFQRTPAPVGEAHWETPESQPPAPHLVRMELGRLTPVFGTAQPPRGLSGAIRRAAYRVPEHRARRWLLLLAADRVEAYGPRLAVLGAAALGVWLLRTRAAATRR